MKTAVNYSWTDLREMKEDVKKKKFGGPTVKSVGPVKHFGF